MERKGMMRRLFIGVAVLAAAAVAHAVFAHVSAHSIGVAACGAVLPEDIERARQQLADYLAAAQAQTAAR